MGDFFSMAQVFPEIVDCRYLHLEMEFFLMDQQQLNCLADRMLKQMVSLTDGIFFCDWDFQNRHMKPETISQRILESTKWIDFGFEGAVLGELVHNRKSFAELKRFVSGPSIFYSSSDWNKYVMSIDYRDVYSRYFANASSDEEYKEALLRIFNEPARKKLAIWRNFDVTCSFFSCPLEHYNGLYYGRFCFSVAFACLGSQGISMSEKLAEIARQTAQEFININARVALTPFFSHESCSGHLHYFPGFVDDYDLPRSDFSPLETRKFLFSPGAEWFNILSPLQQSLVPFLARDAEKYPQIAVEAISGGGKVVRLKKAIDAADVADLAEVKRLLYDALLPGARVLKLKDVLDPEFYVSKPRLNWEIVPIFEEEIDVYAGYVVFRHILS